MNEQRTPIQPLCIQNLDSNDTVTVEKTVLVRILTPSSLILNKTVVTVHIRSFTILHDIAVSSHKCQEKN